MFQCFATVVTYCAYSALGIAIPCLAVYVLYPDITWDLGFAWRLVRLQRWKRKLLAKNITIVDRYEELVAEHGAKTFLHFDGQTFSYSDINKQANRLMNYLVAEKEVRLRDVVCMLMYNDPLFVSTWLAIMKCGATAALLNNHIRGKSLMHCIKISGSKLITCASGIPKASKVIHHRVITPPGSLSAEDVFYICLPLYHSAAFTAGLANVISQGATAALRRKFSVRHFWDDVRRYRCTVIQYIGETARYLTQAPRSDQDGVYPQGPIKLGIGNGLPVDIWREFKKRFNIQMIVEFYAATEGNYVIVNTDGKEGTVGRYTLLQEKLLGVLQIIECDTDTAEPKRGPDGLCIPCPRGKAGLLGTKVSKRLPIDGYVGDEKITEKKMIRDVLKKGDCYFNTGDLMLIDTDGYVYFKDRLGNTFRWKGENVATTEVELALLEYPQVKSANVYGVKIEGKDGRAGMASLVLQNNVTLDCPAMYAHITHRLPNYACPKFICIKESIEVTGTFKHRKVNLIKKGFDPKTTSDPLYYMNDKERTYSILDEESFNGILADAIWI